MIYFLLPALNEAQNLPKLIENLDRIGKGIQVRFAIVVVDDGSIDDTPRILEVLSKSFPLTVLTHPKNQGPGQAFHTGFTHILNLGSDEDFIISMDADNTHSPKTIGMMVAALNEGYEVVIASIFAPGGMMIGVPFLRYFLTISCNLLYRLLFPVRGIREYTGFYRGYSVGTLRNAREMLRGSLFEARGFGAMAELLIRLRQIPVFMKEVPMMIRYDQKGGRSKMKIMVTIREHLGILMRNLFQRRIV